MQVQLIEPVTNTQEIVAMTSVLIEVSGISVSEREEFKFVTGEYGLHNITNYNEFCHLT